MNTTGKWGLKEWLILFFALMLLFSLFSGGSGSTSSNSSKVYHCRMCGRTISSSQYKRTNGYCASCAKILQERIDRH